MADFRHRNRQIAGDFALCAFVGLCAGILLYGSASLPAPRFEPLGSAALPRALAVILLVLSAIIAVRAVLRLKGTAAADEEPTAESAKSGFAPHRAALLFAALVVYVAALDVFRVPFVPATTAMMTASGLILHRADWRTGLLFAALGLGLSLALSFVFTHFLYVDIG